MCVAREKSSRFFRSRGKRLGKKQKEEKKSRLGREQKEEKKSSFLRAKKKQKTKSKKKRKKKRETQKEFFFKDTNAFFFFCTSRSRKNSPH